MRRSAVSLAAALGALLPAPAAASDGVIEIDQARALAGGVTGSDTAGFPVTLDTPGSYVLTSNLFVPAAAGGVVVTAEHVTLDLGGFLIEGAVGSLGAGVQGGNLVRVHGGSVRRFGAGGVVVGAYSRADEIHADGNWAGIVAGGSSIVSNSTLRQNVYGVSVGSGAIVEGCIVAQNQYDGITLSPAASVRHSFVSGNQSRGVVASGGALIQENAVGGNLGRGIQVGAMSGGGAGTLVADNWVSSGTADGIWVYGRHFLLRNLVVDNRGIGLALPDPLLSGPDGEVIIRHNVASGNALGDLSSYAGLDGGVELGWNSCGGLLGC
jgi:hypothetical protein